MIHNFSLLMEELGSKDDQVAEFVENSNAVFATLANQDANIRDTLRELPSALDATQKALASADAMATELGPTLEDLRPGGPRARAGAAPDAPVPDRDDADHPRPAAAVRARRAPHGARAAPRAARPRRRHA